MFQGIQKLKKIDQNRHFFTSWGGSLSREFGKEKLSENFSEKVCRAKIPTKKKRKQSEAKGPEDSANLGGRFARRAPADRRRRKSPSEFTSLPLILLHFKSFVENTAKFGNFNCKFEPVV